MPRLAREGALFKHAESLIFGNVKRVFTVMGDGGLEMSNVQRVFKVMSHIFH